jgi:hypothetical protein
VQLAQRDPGLLPVVANTPCGSRSLKHISRITANTGGLPIRRVDVCELVEVDVLARVAVIDAVYELVEKGIALKS